MKNFGLPTKDQWNKIVTAGIYSFVSGFLASIVAQGGFTINLDWTTLTATAWAALVSGINVSMYTIYTTFFKPTE